MANRVPSRRFLPPDPRVEEPYRFTPKLALQLNIENLFDKKYYSNIDGQAYFGTPRNAVATLSYAF